MLALPPLKPSNADDKDAGAGGFTVDGFLGDDDCFLDSIDFSSIFEGFDFAADLLPELDFTEPHVGAVDLSESSAEAREEQEIGSPESPANTEKLITSLTPESRRGAGAAAKNSHGKKKMKVDWTPELHRRFVMVVEELGVDKAVPSRILEIMGHHNLTRHNVASHLQKYRSHRKHSLAREAEAGSWSHRRQIYAAAAAGSTFINPAKNNKLQRCEWVSPSHVGYPPNSLQLNNQTPQLFGPLHVWGHPTVDRPALMRATWQGHSAPFQCPQPAAWPQPQNYIAYWRPHFHGGSGEGWGPSAVTPAPHFMPQPLPGMRYAAPMQAAGVLPQPVYRPHLFLSPLGQHHPQLNTHPSKESIDEAIGDVLAKPWLPLPLGLKPPSTESVLGELQRQGVPKVPPPACNNPEAA